MIPPKELPKVDQVDGALGGQRETHPAYGQISASRVSGDSLLYGSDFKHRHFVTISITRSELNRNLNRDHAFAREELIEVKLSEAQWAMFVSTLNQGSGTQCTLNRFAGEHIPQIAALPNRRKQFTREMEEHLKEADALAKKLQHLIETNGKKSEMRETAIHLSNALSPNITFVAKQFGEHMETVTEHAKIEVSAYIEAHIQRAGLKALGADSVLQLEEGNDA